MQRNRDLIQMGLEDSEIKQRLLGCESRQASGPSVNDRDVTYINDLLSIK